MALDTRHGWFPSQITARKRSEEETKKYAAAMRRNPGLFFATMIGITAGLQMNPSPQHKTRKPPETLEDLY